MAHRGQQAQRTGDEGCDRASRDREQPTHINRFAEGNDHRFADDFAGRIAQLLFTTLSGGSETAPRSQIQLLKSDGSGARLSLAKRMRFRSRPLFTPYGAQILFASNRAGALRSIWQMSAVGGGRGVTQLTSGEGKTHFGPRSIPSRDPRLFYYGAGPMVWAQPRLYMTRLGTTTRTDLSRSGGMQPHINPKGDKIVFAASMKKTASGKSDDP